MREQAPFVWSLALIGFFLGVAPLLPRQKTWARTLVVAVGLAVALRYLAWRLMETLEPGAWCSFEGAWFLFVFTVEIVGFVNQFLLHVALTRVVDRSGEADAYEAELRHRPAGKLPRVDVFICTYNEGMDVLERTIVAALAMDYPNFTVWVLDDGRRDWLQEYCATVGARYLRRPDNRHAKAGNINHALKQTDAELIAVLDADFAPCWNFLYRTVGFFHDPRVAILQTPQYFHNPDPIQSNLGLTDLWPDDQRLFFDVILPSRDAWGCAWCCGTGSVIRREAIEAIGGVPTDSITEDLLSTLVLMRRGYLTRYLNERLCTGLAPESLKGFFQQRERWCRGNLQILFLKAGPLGPGLTLFQRLMFLPLDWVIQYVGRLMTVLVPIVFLWTGIGPFRIPSLEDLISYQVPVFLSALGVIRWFAPNSYLPIISTASCLFSSFRIVPTGLATLIKPFGTPFKVTPKGSSNTFSFGDFMILTLALGLMALTVGGLIKNRVAPADLADHGAFLIVAEAWAVVNLFLLAVAALIAIESPPPPDAERRPCGVAAACRVQGEEFPCRVLDLSVSEASLEGEVPLRADTLLELVLDGVGTLPGRVLRAERNQAEVAFDDRPGPHRDRLIQYVYTAGRTNLVPSVHGWKVMTGLVKAFWRS